MTYYTANDILKSKIDIKKGEATEKQCRRLVEIALSEDSDLIKFENVFLCLHNYKPIVKDYEKLMDYFNEIILDLEYCARVGLEYNARKN